MSDGATKSAPASACDTAVSTSRATVGSLTTCSPSRMPQWPCEVYSHRHTSVSTSKPGTPRLIARTAVCTGARGSDDFEPIASLCSGRPKSRTPAMPSCFAAAASCTASSTDSWKMPGIEPIGPPDVVALAHEERVDEAVRRQPRLANQRPNRFGGPQAPRASRQRQA